MLVFVSTVIENAAFILRHGPRHHGLLIVQHRRLRTMQVKPSCFWVGKSADCAGDNVVPGRTLTQDLRSDCSLKSKLRSVAGLRELPNVNIVVDPSHSEFPSFLTDLLECCWVVSMFLAGLVY